MKISDLVCSLENSKNLINIGIFDLDNYKYFYYYLNHKFSGCPENAIFTGDENFCSNKIPAFTAQELLEKIDAHIRISKDVGSNINVYYQPDNCTGNSYNFSGENLADLLAKVLIAESDANLSNSLTKLLVDDKIINEQSNK